MSGTGENASLPSEAAKAYSLIAMPPTAFDKYTLIGKLGRGGMAEVNLAVVEGRGNFRKLVVIKRLHSHLALEPGFIEMFLDEATLAARLMNHPHVVQTYEVGEHDGSHFLAMEYLDGQGLERVLRMSGQRGEHIPIEIGARMISDALDGLAYAHEATDFDGTPLGVVHRDVSPQNIFITYNGVVKLLDFGIAKATTQLVETRTGVIKGKYAYIAPEQALAEEVDHRADLWSTGVVLWEVLTGRRLFKSVNELATLQETLQGEVKPPSAFRPELPPELDTICMRALQRDVSQRYESAHAMKEDLDRYLASLRRPPSTKHVARFMRERFDEVITQHKATLALCLKGDGEPTMSSSSIDQLVDARMMTPSGVREPVSITPTASRVQRTPRTSSTDVPMQAAPPPAPEGGSIFWKLTAIVLAALLAGAAALFFSTGESDEPPGVPNAREEGLGAPPLDEVDAREPPAHVQDEPNQDEPNQSAEEQPAEQQPAEEQAPEATTKQRASRRARRERRQPQAQPAEAAEAPSEAPGFLTLATTPWTRVRLAGRDLGTTPLIRVELPPGTHTLHLENDAEGIAQTYRVTIRSGEAISRRLGLR